MSAASVECKTFVKFMGFMRFMRFSPTDNLKTKSWKQ